MNYMLLIYDDERVSGGVREGTSFDDCVELCGGLVDRLKTKGQYLSAGILQPSKTATCVRLREGRQLVTDGPFAETREQLAGYLMINAANLDEAIAIAAEHPVAQVGTVEVRPVFGIPFDHSPSSDAPTIQDSHKESLSSIN